MVRLLICAAFFGDCASAIAPVSPDVSCAASESFSSIELDESSMLQQLMLHVPVSAGGTIEQPTTANDVLAGALSLFDAAKEKRDDSDHIVLRAKAYANMVTTDVIPNLSAAIVEISNLLAIQRTFVKQCDSHLEAGAKAGADFRHDFIEKQSLHATCVEGERWMAAEVADCLDRENVQSACAHLQASHAAKAADCRGSRSVVDAAACAQATQAHAMCETYGLCRTNSIAVYEQAAHFATKQTNEHSMQLVEANTAKCIADGLAAFVGDMDSMTKQLEQCNTLTPDASGETEFDVDDANALPPAMACQNIVVQACSDDVLKLNVGPSQTWSAPCSSCPVLAGASVKAAAKPPNSAPSRFSAWLLIAKERAKSTWEPLRLLGTKTADGTAGKTANAGQYALVLLAVALIALCLVLGAAVMSSQSGHSSDGDMLPRVSACRRSVSAFMEQRRAVHSNRGSVAHFMENRGSVHSTSSTGSIDDRLSESSETVVVTQAPASGRYSMFAQSNFVVNRKSPIATSNSTLALCPRLTVPQGHEVIVAIPSLAGAAVGEMLSKTITDMSGQALLYVGVNSCVQRPQPRHGLSKGMRFTMRSQTTSTTSEYIMIATKDQQRIAYCEVGDAVQSEGWSAVICRGGGELYARLSEEDPSEIGRRSVVPGSLRTFVLASAFGDPWHLRLTGNFRDRMFSVEDDAQRLVAVLSSEDSPDPMLGPHLDSYKLRLGPQSDSACVILALLAIERLSSQAVSTPFAPSAKPRRCSPVQFSI